MEPGELDLVAAMVYYHDQWAVLDSPFRRASEYLSKIDLFGKDNEKGLKIGDLDFLAPGVPRYSDDCGVFSEVPITASLLQARLIELGHNTSLKIVDQSCAFSLARRRFLSVLNNAALVFCR